ncbi:EFR1 family ferrodoxin [Serpentinicella alkaliphila]|uniref:4Fe-4S ferredoxin-type domain-containing protein n=1 Tax=Serpentinicella alkaliphila TaxID=1734049 RepID=A0A4R2TYY5_9FIRM|nr:EFR1 family ferrodoxin [Serpentinicella alkaliphila]QUH26616.1 4Fe-4S ferredoxin [Serpentinicella alkaliphila]TCQ02919.1 hypothetical protein EDD79_101249 [Serpentinicella alkaliphila]
MEYKHKILILYHSGAGSTKTIAEIYYKMLHLYSIDISTISFEYEYNKLHDYNFIIFAFPTYHCSPSTSMKEFIKNIPVFDKPKKAFVFTTCGLFSGNALREFIKECSPKNISINGFSVYRAPATDGVLLLPPIYFMFNYEKNIAYKIKSDIKKIEQIINTDTCIAQCPSFKLYEILNYPNKVCGKAYRHKLKILKENCVHCKKCADICIRNCWDTYGEFPQYEGRKCEFCFKCVHHCPNGAIILSAKTKTKIKLNEKFYENLREKIINEIL